MSIQTPAVPTSRWLPVVETSKTTICRLLIGTCLQMCANSKCSAAVCDGFLVVTPLKPITLFEPQNGRPVLLVTAISQRMNYAMRNLARPLPNYQLRSKSQTNGNKRLHFPAKSTVSKWEKEWGSQNRSAWTILPEWSSQFYMPLYGYCELTVWQF